jgi:hypothetical protein
MHAHIWGPGFYSSPSENVFLTPKVIVDHNKVIRIVDRSRRGWENLCGVSGDEGIHIHGIEDRECF